MLHVGFEGRMITTIMSSIKSILYSTLLNEEPVGCIKPSKGLRQGNPLSH